MPEGQLSETNAAKPEVVWPDNWRERFQNPDEWEQHVLPIGETTKAWEQTAPIPTFHRKQTLEGGKEVHHLWYLHSCVDLGVNTTSLSLDETEREMRDSLPFDIEVGKGMAGIKPTPKQIEMGEEVERYFKQKPQNPTA